MGKVMIALAVMSVMTLGVNAQTTKKVASAAPAAKTATTGKTVKKHRRPKKEPVEQNFQICMGNSGYYICSQTPGPYNSTHPGMTIKEEQKDAMAYGRSTWVEMKAEQPAEPVGPVSQSYPENVHTVYGIHYPYRHPNYIQLGPYGYVRP